MCIILSFDSTMSDKIDLGKWQVKLVLLVGSILMILNGFYYFNYFNGLRIAAVLGIIGGFMVFFAVCFPYKWIVCFSLMVQIYVVYIYFQIVIMIRLKEIIIFDDHGHEKSVKNYPLEVFFSAFLVTVFSIASIFGYLNSVLSSYKNM